jgi:tRNA/rRNA methyltransferase
MKNEDVYRCHVSLSIPTNPQFGSLNLASALQVIAYDWRLALAARYAAWSNANPDGMTDELHTNVLADAAQVSGMLNHFEQALQAVKFLDPQTPKKLMPRLNQLFNRSQLTQEEVHILRGVAKAMLQVAAKADAGEAPSDSGLN